MCVLCNAPVLNIHWTDQGVKARQEQRSRLRERNYQIRIANKILTYYGLKVDMWNGIKIVIADKKGRVEIVQDLGGLWVGAEKLLGRPLSPLDPGLISYLETSKDHKEKS